MAAVASNFKARRRHVWNSVFPEVSQPTPLATPVAKFPDQGQPFGGIDAPGSFRHAAAAASHSPLHPQLSPHQQRTRRGPPGPPSNAAPLGLGLGFSDAGLGVDVGSSAADDQIAYDRAWHVVTARVALPSTVAAEDSFGTLLSESQLQLMSSQDAGTEAEFQAALQLVLDAKTALPRATHTEDILSWHTQQVRHHFAQHVVPMLSACAVPERVAGLGDGVGNFDQHLSAVMNSIRTLEAARRLYEYGLELILRGYHRYGLHRAQHRQSIDDVDMDDDSTPPELLATRFRKDVRSLVGNSVPPELVVSLRVVLMSLIGRIIGLGGAERTSTRSAARLTSGPGRPGPPSDDDNLIIAARQQLHELVAALAEVGLAGERTQILFAEIMDKLMSDFVYAAFAGTWRSNVPEPQQEKLNGYNRRSMASKAASRRSACTSTLDDWVDNHFARVTLEVLRLMNVEDEDGEDGTGGLSVSFTDLSKWKDIAFGRLAALRISELFDIVLHWPKSKSGLDDLRSSVATPQRRLKLSDSFSAALQDRLLHSSRSTLEILQVYIAMIRTFHILDHSKVLLSRVVPSLQLYLCQREDAIRLVVTGLLANPDEIRQSEVSTRSAADDALTKDTNVIIGPKARSLVELAVLLNDPTQQRRQFAEDDDMDWNDMDWVPDPVDAGVNYKRPKSEDVIGTLIGALGAGDVFIKEFQNIIAERLLSSQTRFDQEIKVLQLLKRRFGEGALQSCDVMIRDIKDSGRLDPLLRRGQFYAVRTPRGPDSAATSGPEAPGEVRYTARILSRLFWPSMAGDTFLLPRPVAEKQRQYGAGYERMKSSRRLTWLDHLGQATVELELRDRTVEVECRTYEAAVVYAFQEEGSSGGTDVRRSVEELQNMLQMDEDLLLPALDFWIGQGVLRRIGSDGYAVVETREAEGAESPAAEDEEDEANGAAAAARGKTGAGGGAVDAKLLQQQMVCWQFIKGMLTNSAASMPLAQIAMMMKMMMAGGFPWSNEELQDFLGQKVAAGEMEVVGGKYKLVKK